MNKNILLYDVYDDNKNVLKSQVILDNHIGFEIPKNYFFNKSSTILKNRILYIMNKIDHIKLYYEICDEETYSKKIAEVIERYEVNEHFINYRGQKIVEYENETGINIICYDGTVILILNSKCKKYSKEYYILYFIAFSFDSDCQTTYTNFYYQKNNFCILKNAKYIYENYKINLIKYNPSELLSIINRKNFCRYISKGSTFDYNISNYYVPGNKLYKEIVDKIEKYNTDLNIDDDSSVMDLVEE